MLAAWSHQTTAAGDRKGNGERARESADPGQRKGERVKAERL